MSPRRVAPMLVSVALVAALAAACTQPPAAGTVPSDYPICVGTPSCLVINNGAVTVATPHPTAISDDGRVMATIKYKSVGHDEFGQDIFTVTLAQVGIDDRWYRPVAVTEPGAFLGGGVMTPDAKRLVFVGGPLSAPTTAADGSSLVGTSGLFVYDGTTKRVSRPAQPAEVYGADVSDDGRFVVAPSSEGIVILDLVAGTYHAIGFDGYGPLISGDGRYVVWSDRPAEPGTLGGVLTRFDRTDGSTVVLPGRGDDPSISRDGARISSHRNPLGCCHAERVQYLDVGDADWTTVAEAVAGGRTFLSRDGRRLIYYLSPDMFGGRTYDRDLTTGVTGDLGPLSVPVAVSANGNHVLYGSPALGIVRWNR